MALPLTSQQLRIALHTRRLHRKIVTMPSLVQGLPQSVSKETREAIAARRLLPAISPRPSPSSSPRVSPRVSLRQHKLIYADDDEAPARVRYDKRSRTWVSRHSSTHKMVYVYQMPKKLAVVASSGYRARPRYMLEDYEKDRTEMGLSDNRAPASLAKHKERIQHDESVLTRIAERREEKRELKQLEDATRAGDSTSPRGCSPTRQGTGTCTRATTGRASYACGLSSEYGSQRVCQGSSSTSSLALDWRRQPGGFRSPSGVQ